MAWGEWGSGDFIRMCPSWSPQPRESWRRQRTWLWAMTEGLFSLSLVTFLLLSLTAHVHKSKLRLDIVMHLLTVMGKGLESLMCFKLMSGCFSGKETFVCGYKTPQDLKPYLKKCENLSKLCTSGSLLFIIFDSVGECVKPFSEGSYAFSLLPERSVKYLFLIRLYDI